MEGVVRPARAVRKSRKQQDVSWFWSKRYRSCFGSDDQLSRLPDELLMRILSNLTLKEAMRTSFLCKRWRYLWTHYPGILEFSKKKKLFQDERYKFVHSLNQVLDRHEGPSVDQLRISFDMGSSYDFSINGWLEFAIAKRIKKLDLDFSPSSFAGLPSSKCIFPRKVGFPSLVSLHLSCVDLTSEDVSFILSNSPLLEELCLHYSWYRMAYPSLEIRDSPSLKHLELRRACKSLVISGAQNLLSFKFIENSVSFHLQDVLPRLTNVSLEGFYPIELLQSNILELSKCNAMEMLELQVDVGYKGAIEIPINFGQLNYLNEMKISLWLDKQEECLQYFSSLLEASPSLVRLAVKLVSYGQSCLRAGKDVVIKDELVFQRAAKTWIPLVEDKFVPAKLRSLFKSPNSSSAN